MLKLFKAAGITAFYLGTVGTVLSAEVEKTAPAPTWPEKLDADVYGDPRQDPETFPRSLAAPSKPVEKAKRTGAALERDRDGGLVLAGPWKMIEGPKITETGETLSRPDVPLDGWFDATVPGTVLTTLVDQGVYPDPYFGLNNLAIPESLNKQDYWYRLEFVPPKDLAEKHLTLIFNGINYSAEVWLNGQRLGDIQGAFIRGIFEVTSGLKIGQPNVLAVRISPPPHPGIPHEQSIQAGPGPNGGAMCADGPTFFCTEGWDWIPGIRDRNAGIWQEVILRATGPVAIGDPQIVTRIPEPVGSRADVVVAVDLTNVSDVPQMGTLKGQFEDVEFEREITLPPGETQTVRFTPADFPQLSVKSPRLWWPNGYGSPELYDLTLQVEGADREVSDRKTLTFGMREISVLLSAVSPQGPVERYEFSPAAAGREEVIKSDYLSLVKSPEGWMPTISSERVDLSGLQPSDETSTAPYLALKVNGQKIVLRGGNWGMDDAMKRVSRERLEPYFRLQREANFNVIRNWCGQSTEEVFFELADEYGMLVWNEFWITSQGNNLPPAAPEPFLANAKDTIKRFRNHPSIALWCGRNEGVPPVVINDPLAALIRDYDGTRYYQPNSILFNIDASGPWSYLEPEEYFTGHQGLTTEIGLPSPLTEDGIRAMLPPEDLWPFNDVWAYHDWIPSGAMNATKFMAALEARYGPPKDFSDFVRKAQMVNYVTHRAMFEGVNASLWQPTTGRLMWMSHPAWPSMVWQIYGHDYEPNAAFYGVKKACEPVHVQMNLPDQLVLVSNTTTKDLKALTVTATVYGLDGRRISSKDASLDVPANSTAVAFQVDAEKPGEVRFISLELHEATGTRVSENFYWHAAEAIACRALDTLPGVELELQAHAKRGAEKTTVVLDIANSSQAVVLMAHATLRDASNRKRILPAFATDNYLNLLPGQQRRITFECAPPKEAESLLVTLNGWNVIPSEISVAVASDQ